MKEAPDTANPADEAANRALIPQVRRARDFHLYGFSGQRILDLWRGDGAAILGHSVAGLGNAVKARISQGLVYSFPHPSQAQVERLLGTRFPRHDIVLCPDFKSAERVLSAQGLDFPRSALPILSDLVPTKNMVGGEEGLSAARVRLWLPFLSLEEGSPDILVFPLPGIVESGPVAILGPKAQAGDAGQISAARREFPSLSPQGFEKPHVIPPYQNAAILKILPILERCGAFGHEGPVRDEKGLADSLGFWNEAFWAELDCGVWKRRGPYLVHDFSGIEYAEVFRRALEKGILLNPRADGPSILPGLLSAGEKKSLEQCLSWRPGSDAR